MLRHLFGIGMIFCSDLGAVETTTVSNPAPITIPAGAPFNTSGPADPYPIAITVSGVPGVITNMSVDLFGFTHTYPSDLGALLQAPNGVSSLLFNGVGGSDHVFEVNYRIENGFPSFAFSANPNGTYSPTDVGSFFRPDLPSPAPPGPYVADLSVFNGMSPNGIWLLYVFDFAGADVGGIFGGWALNFTTTGPEPEPKPVPILVVDAGAISSALFSGLPTALAARQAHLLAAHTALRDVNGRLFRLRAGADDKSTGESGSAQDYYDPSSVGEGDGDYSITTKLPREVAPARRDRRWEIFTGVDYGAADLDSIGRQAGVDADTWSASVGAEYRLTPHLVLGLSFSYLESDQDFTQGLGGQKLDGPAVSPYVSYVGGPFWSDLLYSFGSYNFESDREPIFGPNAHGEADTRAQAVQFNTGWNFGFCRGRVVTGPFLGVDYLHGSLEGYEESGGGTSALRFGGQSYDSMVARLGWHISRHFETGLGSITPQLHVAYEHETLDDEDGVSVHLLQSPYYLVTGRKVTHLDRDYSARLETRQPGQDYLAAGAGLQWLVRNGIRLLVDYEGRFFRSDLTEHFVGLRASLSF
jgi:uncharacterized protein YhjY with autotransporter beta-barrel domain